MKKNTILLFICLVFLFCSEKKESKVSEARQITVSILPQKYFVGRITKEKWDINVMIPPGHNPATYEPTPVQMKALGQSRIYFRIGHIIFEKAWMDNLISLNPQMKVVDTSQGVTLIKADPHIWLSPMAVKKIASNILDTLREIDPENQSIYENNFQEFINDIVRLNTEITRILKKLRGKKFMVYHPAWSYFARDYGLIQLPIEIDGKHPRPADLLRVINTAKKERIDIIFVQKQFDTHNAEAIAKEINGKVIPIDPLAQDWMANMRRIARTIKDRLE